MEKEKSIYFICDICKGKGEIVFAKDTDNEIKIQCDRCSGTGEKLIGYIRETK